MPCPDTTVFFGSSLVEKRADQRRRAAGRDLPPGQSRCPTVWLVVCVFQVELKRRGFTCVTDGAGFVLVAPADTLVSAPSNTVIRLRKPKTKIVGALEQDLEWDQDGLGVGGAETIVTLPRACSALQATDVEVCRNTGTG